METDKYGTQILSENDICTAYLRNPDINIKRVYVNEQLITKFIEMNNAGRFFI